MSGTFVSKGNEPLFPKSVAQEKLSLEDFKIALRDCGVYPLELVWGNHVGYYREIPEHLMSLYLAERPRLLHVEALAKAKRTWEERKYQIPLYNNNQQNP